MPMEFTFDQPLPLLRPSFFNLVTSWPLIQSIAGFLCAEPPLIREDLGPQNCNIDSDVRVRCIGIVHAEIAPNDIVVSIQSRRRE